MIAIAIRSLVLAIALMAELVAPAAARQWFVANTQDGKCYPAGIGKFQFPSPEAFSNFMRQHGEIPVYQVVSKDATGQPTTVGVVVTGQGLAMYFFIEQDKCQNFAANMHRENEGYQ